MPLKSSTHSVLSKNINNYQTTIYIVMDNITNATKSNTKPLKGNGQGTNGGGRQRVVPYVPGLKIKYLVPDPFGTGR